ncbi:MAG: hypothetical protein ACKOZU_00975 [Planctomycetaceae bacterium]
MRRSTRHGILAACLVTLLAAVAPAADEVSVVRIPEEMGAGEVLADSSLDDQACMEALRECCGCPNWSRYAVFDALVLQRSNQTGDRPIILNLANRTLATTQDLDPTVGTGLRAVYGTLVTDRWGWEAGYLGLWNMFGSVTVNGPNNLRTPEPLAFAINNFGDAHTARATYLSSLNMAEINLFRYAARTECRQSCTGSGCTGSGCTGGDRGTSSCHMLTALAGFVWAGLDERAGLAMTCCADNETAAYNVRTSTNYFGAQVGMQGRREWRCWAVEGWWKTALCGVSASQASDPITGTIFGSRDARSAHDGGLGFIGNVNGSVIYRLTDTWGLRCGYTLIWLTNAALAPSQWDFTDTPASGSGINDNGTVFLHGANLGLEARW